MEHIELQNNFPLIPVKMATQIKIVQRVPRSASSTFKTMIARGGFLYKVSRNEYFNGKNIGPVGTNALTMLTAKNLILHKNLLKQNFGRF